MEKVLIFCARYLYVAVFIIAAIYFFRQQKDVQIKIVFLGLLSAAISYMVALVAGQIYFDPRPFVEGHFKPLIEHDMENGFPSDHVLLVSCVAAVVTVFNKPLAACLWFLTCLVAYARVFVGVHHYLDVIASMIITVSVTAAVYLTLYKKYADTVSKKAGRLLSGSKSRTGPQGG